MFTKIGENILLPRHIKEFFISSELRFPFGRLVTNSYNHVCVCLRDPFPEMYPYVAHDRLSFLLLQPIAFPFHTFIL